MNKKIILTVVALLATVLLPLQAATDYGIRIGSTYINSDNNNNVTGDGISTRANGKIAYDPTTNVLTLKGAYVDCLGKYFPNSPMLAAVVKVANIMEKDQFMQQMMDSYRHKFAKKPEVIEGNMRALERGFTEVK